MKRLQVFLINSSNLLHNVERLTDSGSREDEYPLGRTDEVCSVLDSVQCGDSLSAVQPEFTMRLRKVVESKGLTL